MLSNSYAYQAEVQHRRQQLRADLARRQQAKLARRNRNHTPKGGGRRLLGNAVDIRARSAAADLRGRRPGPAHEPS